jgi:adenosylcobinamide-phosphate synthase
MAFCSSWFLPVDRGRPAADTRVAMYLPGLHDPLLLLYAGLIIDALFGEMSWLFRRSHPIALAGRAIAAFERKLNRAIRSDKVRRGRGILTVMVLVGVAAAIGVGLRWLFQWNAWGAAGEALTIGVLMAQRSLHEHVAAVGRALSRDGLAAGRTAVGHIVGRDPASLDAAGVARAAIESLAENFSDGIVAPACWYLVLGLPGLFAYKMANTLDSMIGHHSARYRSFGWAAARLDDLLNLVPAPISGVLLAIAATFSGGARPLRAFRIMLRDGRKHRSPNAGWPEAAMAGALDLELAGPRHYAEGTVNDPWLGDGTTMATPADISRALRVYLTACLILAALLLGAWLARHFRAVL